MNLQTDLSGVVGSSGYLFARETSPAFARLDQSYYDTCTSSDPNIQKNCTKLQFAWLQVAKNPDSSKGTKRVATPTGTVAVVAPANDALAPAQTIQQVKQTGGAITTASSGNSNTNTDTCIANTGNNAICQQQNQVGSGKNGDNSNNTQIAKVIDPVEGIPGRRGRQRNHRGRSHHPQRHRQRLQHQPNRGGQGDAGFRHRLQRHLVWLFTIPTRQELNRALHSISAEPYASMQSVALEAIEQFGMENSLALTDRAVPLTHNRAFCKTDDGHLMARRFPRTPCQLRRARKPSVHAGHSSSMAPTQKPASTAPMNWHLLTTTFSPRSTDCNTP